MKNNDFKISLNVQNKISQSLHESFAEGKSTRIIVVKAFVDGWIEHLKEKNPLSEKQMTEGLRYYYRDSKELNCDDVFEKVGTLYLEKLKALAREGFYKQNIYFEEKLSRETLELGLKYYYQGNQEYICDNVTQKVLAMYANQIRDFAIKGLEMKNRNEGLKNNT